jgi:hypothetical protein
MRGEEQADDFRAGWQIDGFSDPEDDPESNQDG